MAAFALVRNAQKGRWVVIPTAHYTLRGNIVVWKSIKEIILIKELDGGKYENKNH